MFNLNSRQRKHTAYFLFYVKIKIYLTCLFRFICKILSTFVRPQRINLFYRPSCLLKTAFWQTLQGVGLIIYDLRENTEVYFVNKHITIYQWADGKTFYFGKD